MRGATAGGGRGAALMLEAEILRGRLQGIVAEMAAVLQNTARSPTIAEGRNLAAALVDDEGRLVAMGEAPFHLAAVGMTARRLLDYFQFDIQDGDVLISNDPYHGGTALHTLTLAAPLIHENELVLFPVVRAQVGDLGGDLPGGLNPAAFELWQEAIRVTPLKLVRAGVRQEDVWRKLRANSRAPELLDWDLRAMLAACALARERLLALLGEAGVAGLRERVAWLLRDGRTRARALLAAWPPGSYEGEARLDDGSSADGHRVRACVSIEVERAVIDFAGSARQVRGPLNSALATTVACALLPFLAAAGEPPPLNQGLLAAFEVRAPEGSLINPRFPAATGYGAATTGVAVAAAVGAALAAARPERAATVHTYLPSLTLAGVPGGVRLVEHLQLGASGAGASMGADGWGLPAPLTGALSPSAEELELRSGWRVLGRELVAGSAGAGRWRGAPACRVVLRNLGAPARAQILVAGGRHPLPGHAGGQAGAPPAVVVRRPGEPEEVVVGARAGVRLPPGAEVVIAYPGGPGWGMPGERPAEEIAADLADELLQGGDGGPPP